MKYLITKLSKQEIYRIINEHGVENNSFCLTHIKPDMTILSGLSNDVLTEIDALSHVVSTDLDDHMIFLIKTGNQFQITGNPCLSPIL